MNKRIQREGRTVQLMIDLYCRKRLKQKEMPEEYRRLQDYCLRRLQHCRWGARKPTCEDCPCHCYAPRQRRMIREVMRWVGPRMLFYAPAEALRHLVEKWKKGPHPSPPR